MCGFVFGKETMCFFICFSCCGSLDQQLAGVVPERNRHEPDLTAEATRVGPPEPTATSQGLPIQLQSGLQ